MPSQYSIILFYKYVILDNPEAIATQQRAWCRDLNLKGRTIIAAEGINSTLEGQTSDIEEYISRMQKLRLFGDIHWKLSSDTSGTNFPKLSIKVRSEIVSTHLDVKDKLGPHVGKTGNYLSPEELHEWITSSKKFYIVDMRNDYEYSLGHFENSILIPDLEHFRDLPKSISLLQNLNPNYPIVTVCTGGVRCEKASGFLVHNNFENIYQLEGGIVSYMEKYPNQDFLGKLFVFDGRIVMGFETNSSNHVIVGKCQICNAKSENILDYYLKNSHIREYGIICQDCLSKGLAVADTIYHSIKDTIPQLQST